MLETPHPFDGLHEPRVRARAGDGEHLHHAEQERWQVDERKHTRAEAIPYPAWRALGEDEREVHEQRRQEENRDFVGPEEDPVETIEATAVREREDPEERDRQPEEVKRRLVARPTNAHRGTDQQAKKADAGEHEVD